MVRATSARPSGARREVPAKMTSSILPPRRLLAPCSPMTQARASATLDLPEPFGPTTQVIPGSRRSEVADANDLKPLRVRLLTYTSDGLLWGGSDRPHSTGEEHQRCGSAPCPLCSWCSVCELASRLNLYHKVGAQPIIVVLQIFDHALKVAHPRPQAGALNDETII